MKTATKNKKLEIEAIILAYPIAKKEEIKAGDLVQIVTEYNSTPVTSIVDHINPNFRRINNPYKYFIKCENDEVANYCEQEIKKCNIAFFDKQKWEVDNKMVFLGHISKHDMDHITAKKLNDLDLGWSDADKLTLKDFDGMIFKGLMDKKQIVENQNSDLNIPLMSVIHYFRVNYKS